MKPTPTNAAMLANACNLILQQALRQTYRFDFYQRPDIRHLVKALSEKVAIENGRQYFQMNADGRIQYEQHYRSLQRILSLIATLPPEQLDDLYELIEAQQVAYDELPLESLSLLAA